MSFERHRLDWERLAADDPLWAVLTHPGRRGGRWEPQAFLATGEAEVAAMLDVANALGLPERHERALDFGCGAGRLTRALAGRFDEAVGVDIAEGMVAAARRLNSDIPNATFVQNVQPDLACFRSDEFDLVYSNIVLQHLPTRGHAELCIREFLRVTRPDGLVVFGVPDRIAAPYRWQLTRRAYVALRRLGVSDEWLLSRTPLTPMRMTVVPEHAVAAACRGRGASILQLETTTDGPVRTKRYFVSPTRR